jgi:putative nucleotidyltransferase with HDIG domain
LPFRFHVAAADKVLKKIGSSQLRPGMYVHELGGDWFSHPFLRSRFKIQDDADVERIVAAGIHEVYIDTERGLDLSDGKAAEDVAREVEQEMIAAVSVKPPPVRQRVALADELVRAQKLHAAAHTVVRQVMQDVRLGKAVQLEKIEGMVADISDSILRNPGALLSLLRLKNADEYTFLHSVAVGTMLVAFARGLGFDMDLARHAGVGGLVHDLGKMKVPGLILKKPGRLTDTEFVIIQTHPEEGYRLLQETQGINAVALEIALHHHERADGSGYPQQLAGAGISQMARMAAIVDVYDAITSDRVYHKGIQPTDALRKMWEWSKFHFDQPLLQSFMRTIGIYPVGSLVRLESGRLGVVVEQNEGSLLAPTVRVFFSIKANAHIAPETVDLSRALGAGGGDKIASHETPEEWGVDPLLFLQAS